LTEGEQNSDSKSQQSDAVKNKYFNFSDADFESHLKDPKCPNNVRIVEFLTHMAICHTVT